MALVGGGRGHPQGLPQTAGTIFVFAVLMVALVAISETRAAPIVQAVLIAAVLMAFLVDAPIIQKALGRE